MTATVGRGGALGVAWGVGSGVGVTAAVFPADGPGWRDWAEAATGSTATAVSASAALAEARMRHLLWGRVIYCSTPRRRETSRKVMGRTTTAASSGVSPVDGPDD